MMQKAAVVIGVDKTGDLPTLSAAVSGAERVAKWAFQEQFVVELLTDRKGSAVTVSQIKDAIKRIVDARTYSQLIVYFSGHGVLRGPDNELWLLSGSPDDPSEAVAVPISIWFARNSGIEHVVFISDACRSTPATARLNGVVGSPIFPNSKPAKVRPDVDVFYATLPGDPAYEVPVNDAVQNYRGLFTECILEGLTQQPIEVMEERLHPPPQCWVVPSWTMKRYLDREIPDKAAAVSIKLVQNPEIRVESHSPKCLIECPQYKPVGGLAITASKPSDESGLWDAIRDPASFMRDQRRGDDPAASRFAGVEQLLAAKGRQSFETRTGFTVVGTNVRDATAGQIPIDLFVENGTQQIRVHADSNRHEKASMLIQFEQGNGVVLPVLSGFVGRLVVDHGRLVSATYLPSVGTALYQSYEYRSDDVEKRHALIASAARNGAFQIDVEKARALAEFLRHLKGIDPMFGVYASYAYAQIGAVDDIKSVFRYMASDQPEVPFDVALLAGQLPGYGVLANIKGIASFCPLLTQGWAFLDPYEEQLPEEVRAVRQHLVPALWTTFTSDGVGLLWPNVEKGTLR